MSFNYRLIFSGQGAPPSDGFVSEKQILNLCPFPCSIGNFETKSAESHWIKTCLVTPESAVDPKKLREASLQLSDQLKMDVNWVNEDQFNFKPKLLMMDVDSTLIQQETIDVLGKKMGMGSQMAEITERAMQGKVKFSDALEERLIYLVGLKAENFLSVLPELTLQEGVSGLLAWAKQQDIKTACVSGGFALIVDKLAQENGIDYAFAHKLEFTDERFTGKISSPIMDSREKAKVLTRLCKKLKITPEDVISVGDGANDTAMLKKSKLGIGFKPKLKLAKEADVVLNYCALSIIPNLF
jgi:phosphoserine phosphatase